jgi:hypothetical protein
MERELSICVICWRISRLNAEVHGDTYNRIEQKESEEEEARGRRIKRKEEEKRRKKSKKKYLPFWPS